ncbi:OmpA family protein [Candidatus Nitrospira inopinata]|uniref:OmpA-like domain-containing protein n=1 Tax=Candidatus Nitrospira inopinata TaxID=1715989 RepID=A0A0S4KR14_9BACT|nr:hypothetical protein [Candidatus Nitrospira inopinata]CUQ66807.1 protein of unknown function [Candidatus Nitrospira inopinata]
MPVRRLGLFDLLAPHYLVGFDFPDHIQRYLSIIAVDELRTQVGPQAILYSGTCSVDGPGGGTEIIHDPPDGRGGRFRWNGVGMRFRLVVPRDGAAFIDTVVNSSANGSLPQVAGVLNDLRPTEPTPADVSDYPGLKFRLELLVDALTFSLGDEWLPGMLHPTTRRVVQNTDPRFAGKPVEIRLPKVLLSYSQGDDDNDLSPQFRLEAWEASGFDGPHDLGVGEFINMEPGVALHRSGSFAFSLDEVILDTSPEATPSEILEHFGVGEDWEGLYIKQLLLYYSNDQGVGFTARLADALFSFNGKVSFEAELNVYPDIALTIFSVTPRFFHGRARVEFRRGVVNDSLDAPPAGDPPGLVNLMQGDVLHLEIGGGTPPYTIEVRAAGADLWDGSARRVAFNSPGTHDVFIKVTDSRAGTPRRHREYLRVVVAANTTAAPPSGAQADRRSDAHPLPALQYEVTAGQTGGHDLIKEREEGTSAHFRVEGGESFTVTVRNHGSSTVLRTIVNQRRFVLDVGEGNDLDIETQYDAISAGSVAEQYIRFQLARPRDTTELPRYFDRTSGDTEFENTLRAFNFPEASAVRSIQLDGYASNDPSNPARDLALSDRRNQAVQAILAARYPGATFDPPPRAHGHGSAGDPLPNPANPADPANRTVRVTFTMRDRGAHTLTARARRDVYVPSSGGSGSEPVPVPPTPDAAPLPDRLPPAIKHLGVRIKIDQGDLALLELYGSIDFESDLEQKLRREGAPPPEEGDASWTSHDGILNFKLIYQWDRAADETTVALQLSSDEEDRDGLLHFDNNVARDDRFKNIVGALMLFAPIINSAAESAAGNSRDAGNWVALGVSVAVPVAIGGLNVFRTRRGILYGGEGRFKWIKPADGGPKRWDFAVILDYGVEFDIVAESLGIGRDRLPGAPAPLPPPLKARYKAIGFNIARGPAGEVVYTAIFDQSKGYDLDLSDPSLFRLPDPLGNLFSIVGARVARFNPVTLEIDFAIKVDLGVITVDRFKVKIPLDPVGAPQILPSGVRVNIPGVLIGNGFVNIVDADVTDSNGNSIRSKGIEGGLDLTLVSLKLRIAGNVAVGTIKDNSSGREAVAVFVGLIVEFPTPIVLGQSGLGLFGLSGLFAMHYRRLEDPRNPTEAVGPALKWLIKAQGEPSKLYAPPPPPTPDKRLWGPEFDRWSFGVGAVLGTLEGGILINFQGMFVLELPGPRILIMVKIRMISAPPKVGDNPNQLSVGIIGIIDLDFGKGTVTVGVMINFEIQELLKIAIPIEIFFNLREGSDWHFYLGTIAQPASAEILNIVRGSAYFMLQGKRLVYAEYGSRVPEFLRNKILPGVAIAAGIEASILLGDPGSIYLRISAALHVGVAFSPFIIVGTMRLEGELRLLIISIGARGEFSALISQRPDNSYKTYLRGEICGSVSFFFFSISACVGIEIGTEDFDLTPPALLRGVFLQSYSPVLVSGQASNQKPIDASLGNATEITGATPAAGDLLSVPIDSVIVLQMSFAPELAATFNADTFTEDARPAPGRPSGGWYELSGDVRLRYTLNSLTLTENGVNYSGTKPPITWRLDRPHQPNGADTAIDLALFSRVPTAAEYAVERSTDLRENITVRWGDVCRRAAPPARVLYAFCGQPLGSSMHGWQLRGVAYPDPPDTVRVEPPRTVMGVSSPEHCAGPSTLDLLLAELGFLYGVPAQIIGDETGSGIVETGPASLDKKCYELFFPERKYMSNPFKVEGALAIYSAATKKNVFASREGGFISEQQFVVNRRYPLRTHMRDIGGYRGVSLREYMRIDVLGDPAQTVTLKIWSKNQPKTTLTAYAYDGAGRVVGKVRWRPASGKGTEQASIRVTATGIQHLILTNRYFTGLLLEVCLERARTRPDIPSDDRCHRVLQLPYAERRRVAQGEGNDPAQLNPDILANYLRERETCAYVTFDTDACEEVLFCGAVYGKFYGKIQVLEVDAMDRVVATHLLSALAPTVLAGPSQLPTRWLDPAGPWRSDVTSVSRLLFGPRFASYDKILFSVKPKPETRKIRISTALITDTLPSMFVALVETLTMGEVRHHATVTESIETDRETLIGYLNDNTPRPLLKPNTVYRLSAGYTVVATHPTRGEVYNRTQTQEFAFRTDHKVPGELASYVLGATPDMDERFHFFADPLKVVFNDPAVLRLVEAYGKQLRAVIRGADGAPVARSPEVIHTLTETPAGVLSPYRETVLRLIEEGLFPCAGGSHTFTGHAVYQAPFELKPLMPYVFDLEYTVPEAVPPGEAVTPLYRLTFQTSRYADVTDFAESHRIYPICHRALSADITGLPVPGGSGTPVVGAADVEIQNALLAAGMPLDDDTETTGFTLLWRETGGQHYPYAILINAAEPLWRFRREPLKRAVVNERNEVLDPAFVVYEQQTVEHLKLRPAGGQTRISHFVRSTGGTRTLAFLERSPAITGRETLTIEIVRTASELFGLTEQSAVLLSLELLPTPPWEA